MKQNHVFSLFFKVAALLIIDAITILLIFSVWMLTNLAVFPWALISILLSLAVLNGTILTIPYFSQTFGPASSYPLIASSVLYYLVTLIFTWIFYSFISVRWYVICMLLILLAFIGAAAAVCVSSIKKEQDNQSQTTEQTKTFDVQTIILNLYENLRKSEPRFSSKEDYSKVFSAYQNMAERLHSSTPFGRISNPAVIQAENNILARLSEVNARLRPDISPIPDAVGLTNSLEEVRILIMNKEKLLLI